MKAGVILDIDGTLLASNSAHAHAWFDALADFGWDVPLVRLQYLIGMGGGRVLHVLYPQMNEEEGIGKVIATRRRHIFMGHYAPTLQPTPGARALVEHLLHGGTRVVVGTSASQAELDVLLQRAGVSDLITEAVTAADVAKSKPSPDVVSACLHKLGLPPSQVGMVGDTPYDIEAARRGKVTPIAVRSGGWQDDELEGAAIYDNPADLLAHFADSPIAKGAR